MFLSFAILSEICLMRFHVNHRFSVLESVDETMVTLKMASVLLSCLDEVVAVKLFWSITMPTKTLVDTHLIIKSASNA